MSSKWQVALLAKAFSLEPSSSKAPTSRGRRMSEIRPIDPGFRFRQFGTWKIGYPRYLADCYTIGSIVSMVPGQHRCVAVLRRLRRLPVAHPVTPKGLGWPRVWSPLLRLVLPIPAFVLNEKTVNLRNATAHPYLFKPSHIFANDSEALIWGFELFSLSSSIELALILGFITVKA